MSQSTPAPSQLAASKGSGGAVEPVAAFVTFEQEEGVARALRVSHAASQMACVPPFRMSV